MTHDKLDALLVLPPMYQSGRMPDYNPKEPMGLMYLAAELRRRGMTVEVLDADLRALTIEETVGEIVARPAAVIGFSVLQRALPSLRLVVQQVRQRGIQSHICCGGVGATLCAPQILSKLPEVDSVVLGDGELVFAQLVDRITSGLPWRTVEGICYRELFGNTYTKRSTKPDLDELRPPARDFLADVIELTNYATIVGSRGCYARCTFCSNSGFESATCGSAWRGRNPLMIADEIEYLRRDCGVKVIKFNDPNLFGPGRRGQAHVELMCQELIRRKLDDIHLMAFTRASDFNPHICRLMRQAGFERVLIGIETANDDALRRFRKGENVARIERAIADIKAAGLDVIPGFIIFHPYTTLDTLEADLDFLDRHNMTAILSKAMRVFSGTALQRLMQQDDRLIVRCPFEGYHEYTVDPIIAAVYRVLKEFAVRWFDPLKSRYQHNFLTIKKGPSFNARHEFYALQRTLFLMESQMLRALISWSRTAPSSSDVVTCVTQAKQQLMETECMLLGEKADAGRTQSAGCSVQQMTELTQQLLRKRSHDTFPEKYRWADD